MNNLLIPRSKFSEFFWQVIEPKRNMWPVSYDLLEQLEGLRTQADYNTGTLSQDDICDLHNIVAYFKPERVAEIGTFIGRSTMAMAYAMDGGEIWTCDVSNNITLPEHPRTRIKQFPKTVSVDMLEAATKDRVAFDLFYIDGRINEQDAKLMMRCERFEGAIIVLDDFEGIEKGVSNASLMLNALGQQGWQQTLIYPRRGGKTALILPFERLKFVNQV